MLLAVSKQVLGGIALLAAWTMCQILEAATFANYFTFTGSASHPDVWKDKAPMPTARLGLATAVVDNKLFAVGGYPAANVPGLSTIEAYDPVTDSWTAKADMPTNRRWLAASAVNGKIYAIGGFKTEGSPALAVVEEYDVATNTWTTKAPMLTARKGFSTAVVNGNIYAIGGASIDEQRLSSVEMYDPATNTWSPKADLPTPRAMLSSSVVDGRIYAIGGPWPGSRGVPTVEEYDPVTDSWTTITDMPTSRWGLSASFLNGNFYSIGGADVRTVLSAVEVYDLESNSWTARRTLPEARWGLSVSTLNDKVYAVGGATTLEFGAGHPGVSTVLEYTPPIPHMAPLQVDDGPLPLDIELPALSNLPLPGWDEYATATMSSVEGQATRTRGLGFLPSFDTQTLVAFSQMGSELGRLTLTGVSQFKVNLSASSAIIDEVAGTIQLAFSALESNEPSTTFSVVEATGIYATEVRIIEDQLLGYFTGHFLLPLDVDPSTTLQDNIFNAFSEGRIIGRAVHGVVIGDYTSTSIPEPTSALLVFLETVAVLHRRVLRAPCLQAQN